MALTARLPCLISLLVGASLCAAAQDTVLVDEAFTQKKVGSSIRYFSTPDSITVDSAARVFENQADKLRTLDKPHLGIVEDDYWFSLVLRNVSGKEQRLMLELDHAHLVGVTFFEYASGRFEDRGTMGMFYPFDQRPVRHRHFVLPLTCAPGGFAHVLVKISHENSLSAAFILWNEQVFHQRDYSLNLRLGIFFGVLFFCSLLSLFCFLMVKQKVFLWYFCYVATASLYLFYDIGAAFQYLYPRIPYIDAPIGIQLPVVMFIFLTLFSQSFLKTRAEHKGIHRTLNILILFFILMLVLVNNLLFSISLWILPALFLVMLSGLVTLIYTGIRTLKSNSTAAALYLAATGSVILSGMYHILAQAYGLLSPEFNPLFIGFLVEVAFLSAALTLQYGQILRERAQLKNELAEHQNRMYRQFIEGIEKERHRIARDLHDNIGSTLSGIKRTYFDNANAEGTLRMAALIEEVRNLSHDLAPPAASVSGLIPLVEQLIGEARINSKIDIRLQSFGFREVLAEQAIQVYRIVQESLNNITRHSKARRADIQVFGYENEMVLTVEDDGVGFDPATQAGFGLNSLRTRVALLKGKIEINSAPGEGCMMVIVVPIPPASGPAQNPPELAG